ncbi:MAG: methyl-accepting chemotaxis protein [Deltaproteobacteria bacterium]|nr:methyl-accepting chemotaxis protein [Candidatus Anaeroferrophillacea bacterium]
MRFKDVKLVMKIGGGFGCLLFLACVLGLVGGFNMNRVVDRSAQMAEEYVPEVDVATRLTRKTLLAMYAMRGYGLTGNLDLRDEVLAQLADVHAELERVRELAERSPHLVTLNQQLGTVESRLQGYDRLVERTDVMQEEMQWQREEMDDYAADCTDVSAAFFAGQGKMFQAQFSRRQEKLQLLYDLTMSGNRGMEMLRLAVVARDAKLLDQAAGHFEDVTMWLEALAALGFDDEERQYHQAAVTGLAGARRVLEGIGKAGVRRAAVEVQRTFREELAASVQVFADACRSMHSYHLTALYRETDNRFAISALIKNILDAVNQLRVANFKAQATRDRNVVDTALEAFSAALAENHRRLDLLLQDDNDVVRHRQVMEAGDSYAGAVGEFLNSWRENDQLSGERDEEGRRLLAAAEEIAAAGMTHTKTIAHETVTLLGRSIAIMGGGFVVMIVCGILIAILITRGITGPVKRGVAFAQALARGDLQATLDVDQKDEVGALAAALNDMADNLRRMIREITDGIATLASSSTEVNTIAGRTAKNTEATVVKTSAVATASEEMSSSMSSVAAAMEQASGNVNTVAAGTEELNAAIGEIARSTEQAREVTAAAVEQAGNSSQRMDELGAAARAIGNVTETIAAISAQTNLLALNATIEAARAGEAGVGFAVVANEIKELAQQTAAATDDIGKKITDIQRSTKLSVGEIEGISRVIRQVQEFVSAIAASMEQQTSTTGEIAANIAQVSEGIREVNQNVNQTAAAAGEVARDVSEISTAADEVSGAAVELEASARGLSELAEKLSEVAKRFTL